MTEFELNTLQTAQSIQYELAFIIACIVICALYKLLKIFF